MAKKNTSQRPSETDHAALKYIAWALLAGVWALAVVSLISFDPADPPAHAYGVPNSPVHNWAGQVGAMIAYKTCLLIGPGVWIGLAGVAAFLIARARGRRVDQLVLRAAGLVVMTVATSAIVGLGLPTVVTGYQGSPEGPGGLLALFINDHLTDRFATPGAMLILIIGFWIGAILAADQWVLAIPRVLGQAFERITDVKLPRPALPQMPSFPTLSWFWARGGAAVEDRPTRTKIPVRSSRSRHKDDADTIDEDAGGFAATESFDDAAESASADGYDEDDYEYEEDEEDTAADAPGAYVKSRKKFDPDELRAKIAKMPINLAPRTKQTAPPPREADLSGYEFPSISMLEEPESDFTEEMEQLVRDQAVHLESALQQYRIQGEVVGIDSGPTITLFEVRLAPGTKVSSLNTVSSDLARALRAQNIRIVPNMAGKDTVGIEVPNLKKELVRLRELMTATADSVRKMKLPMFLGKDASGNPLVADLGVMPHMLIAGTTGSGKSVCMNSIIMSFLFTRRPDEVKLVLVDPKMVEMSLFKDIPHLMCPVVTEMSKAVAILEWAVTKMDERYELLAEVGVRDIASYNDLGWDEIKDRMQPNTEEEEARIPKKLPYLIFLIDELADMIMTHKDVEGHIVRIAQKARAVGIHLILATQRPQANVVTGLIKSNMPCRVSFKVASGMDSRIVLDSKGGEVLLGQGDMLFLSPRSSKLTRAQGCMVDDFEVRRTVKFLKTKAKQHFEPQLVQLRSADAPDVDEEAVKDPLFNDAVAIVLETKRGSVSLLQRRLTIGYSRSSRLIEAMAAAGILGDHKGSQAREVVISLDEWEAMKAQAEADAAAVEQEQHVDEEVEEEDCDTAEAEEEGEYEECEDEDEDVDEGEEEEDEEDGEYEEVAEDDDEYEEVEED